ncbi:MAG: hypothetical protein HFH80_07895 [Lachnospiraceae bacterium]|nr:hypothetical protein [Lachnospiraceae bacterium]
MRNNKQQSISYKKGIFALCLFSAVLLYGCGKKDASDASVPSGQSNRPSMEVSADINNEKVDGAKTEDVNNVKEEGSNSKEDSSPGEAVIKQTIEEWEELFGAFYDYQDCSAVLAERTVNNGTVEELFLLDITYTSDQSDSEEAEHYIADMKASYPEDKPDEITLWQDTSGGAGAGWVLFKECGPG